MVDTTSSAVAAMRALRGEIEARLMNNEDYRALVALDKALAEVSRPASRNLLLDPPPSRRAARGPSQADAVAMVLTDTGRPMSTAELLTAVRAMGVNVSGADPLINLSSSISRDGRFRSERIEGVPRWWLKDRPYPGELDFGGSTDAAASAADNTSHGGSDNAAA